MNIMVMCLSEFYSQMFARVVYLGCVIQCCISSLAFLVSLSLCPYLQSFFLKSFFLNLLCFQPDSLDDLSYAIMYETTKLAYRVSEDDVTRACNQVGF